MNKEGVILEDRDYEKKISGMKFSRVFAWIGVILLVIIVIATAITGIMGSKYFWGCLFMCMVVPFLMYVFMWMGKVLNSVHSDSDKKNIQNREKEKD